MTPGPWQVVHDFDRDGRTTIIGNVDGEIHQTGPTYSYEFVATTADPNDDITSRHTEIANARLIAAAPDLFAALTKARNTLAGLGHPKIAADICDAALASAQAASA